LGKDENSRPARWQAAAGAGLTGLRGLSPRWQGHAAMLLFSALIAGSFSLGARVGADVAPVALNALRFWVAAALVGGLLLWRGGITRQAARAPWRYLVLGGLYAGYFVLMFEGLKTALPVSAAAVFTLTPILTAGFGWLVLRQRLTGRMSVALALGGGGALWVIFRGDLAALMAFDLGRGEAIYFLGCIAHALYAPLVRRLNRGEPLLVFTFGTLLGGGVILTIYGWEALRATDWAAMPAIVWITLAYVAVFASAVTVLIMQFAMMRLPSAKVMAYTYLTPSWVIGWEVALGGRLPPWNALVGLGLTLAALGLLLRDEPYAG
jgi:drug/metabolite transporter (DMT)-like permease